MNILFSTNEKFVKSARVMLYSLCANNKEKLEIYLIYHDLCEESILELRRVIESFGNELHLIDVGREFSDRVIISGVISVEAYYRIIAINLLPKEMGRILYLDSDMVIKGSLRELYDTDICDSPFAAAEDVISIINEFSEENKRRLNIPSNAQYFNSGVLLINLDYCRKNDICSKTIEKIYEEYENYIYLDQDVLNQLYYEDYKMIPWDIYNCPPAAYYIDAEECSQGKIRFATYPEIKKEVKSIGFHQKYIDISDQIYANAIIIHYLGKSKPWLEEYAEVMPGVFKRFCGSFFAYEEKLKNCIEEERLNSKKISVIVPCYNVEKYVVQCIESIVNQTIGIDNLEIILVDDMSKDNTIEILRKYEKTYSDNIILVERDINGGLSAARNTGLQYASGEYVLFVDADDYLCENACQLLYDRAIKGDYDVVSGGIINFDGTYVLAIKQYANADYYLDNFGELKNYLLARGETCSACANLFKRSFITENNLEFEEGYLMEDVAFFIDVFNSAKRISNISDCVYMYRSNSEGIMQSKILQGAIDGHALVINRYDKYSGVEWSDVDREAFEWYLFDKGFYTPVGNVLNSDVVCDDDIIYTFAKNILKRIPKYKGNKCIAEMLQMDEGGIAEFLEFVCHTEF